MKQIRLKLGSVVATFPPPTHRIARTLQEFVANASRELPRVPRVLTEDTVAKLIFEGLAEEWLELNGKNGELVTYVRHLRGVATVEDAKRHFKLEEGISLEEGQVDDSPGICAAVDCPAGTALTIDLGEAGYAPGQTFVYVILRPPHRGALYFAPTHWLCFDWRQLEIQ